MKHALRSVLITSILTLTSVFGSEEEFLHEKQNSSAAENCVITAQSQTSKIVKNFTILDLDNDILDMIILEYSMVEDLINLTKSNKKFSSRIQPILKNLKSFMVSRITPILNRPALTPDEFNMMRLLREDPTSYSYSKELSISDYQRAARKLAFRKEVKFFWKWKWQMLPEAADLFKLAATHPDATVKDMLDIAQEVSTFGAPYKNRATHLFELAVNHPNAIAEHIFTAAFKISSFGEEYKEKAAVLFERLAQCPDTRASSTLDAAEEILKFGTEYNGRALDLLELAASHKSATPMDVLRAAQLIVVAGEEYNKERVITWIERAAQNSYTSPEDIRTAANKVLNFGSEYKERALYLFECAAKHSKASNKLIIEIAERIFGFGATYKQKAFEYVNFATWIDPTAEDLRLAARTLLNFSSEYKDLAQGLFNTADEKE